MNLISCDNCGVAIDASKMNWPSDCFIATFRGGSLDGQVYDAHKMAWCRDRRKWVPSAPCPACNADILKP